MRIYSRVNLGAKFSRRRSNVRGALVVEMAICLPLLIWLTFAIIQYGIIISTTNTLSQLTRDTARYAAIHGGEATADMGASGDANPSTASIKNYLKNECSGTSISYSSLSPNLVVGTLDGSGNVVPNTYHQRIRGSIVTVQIGFDMKKVISTSGLVPGMSTFTSQLYKKRSSILMEQDAQ